MTVFLYPIFCFFCIFCTVFCTIFIINNNGSTFSWLKFKNLRFATEVGCLHYTEAFMIGMLWSAILRPTCWYVYYRAMLRHRYCHRKLSLCSSVRPSVSLSVSDVEVSWSHRLEFFRNNFWLINLNFLLYVNLTSTDQLQREHLKF